jgi:DNA-directed RNA polymerase specialized sigma24 family protein
MQQRAHQVSLDTAAVVKRQMPVLRRKARNYAAFAGSQREAEDLLQSALVAALKKRSWRSDQALIVHCDAYMARQVGYEHRVSRGRR